MPRIRTIKPEFWSDEDLAILPLQARLLYIGIWNLSDDYGICKANPKWIKAQLFPYDDSLRIDQISQWIDQLVKARALIPFTIGEGYLYVRTFKIHQKIDRPSKNGHISADKLAKTLKIKTPETFEEYSTSVPRLIAIGKGKDMEEEIGIGKDSPVGAGEAGASPPNIQDVYNELKKTKKHICDFLKANNPQFIDPYVDLWNLFATEKHLAKVSKISDTRKKKFKVRISEKAFNFLEILRKAGQSEFLLTAGKWFSFDWILENESNYLKIVEGNYDKKDPVTTQVPTKVNGSHNKTVKSFADELDFLYGRYCENNLDERLITEDLFHKMQSRNIIPSNTGAISIEQKQKVVIEFFKSKTLKNVSNDKAPIAN